MINLSETNMVYLGHHFCPTDVNSAQLSISHVQTKLSRIAGSLKSVGQIGRRILTQSLLAPIAQYASAGWSKVKVCQVESIQKIINKSADCKFKANSKILPIDSGGFGLENVFTRYISTQISHLQKQLLINTSYYLWT